MARLGVAGGVGVGDLYGVRLGEPEGDEILGAPLMQVPWRIGGGTESRGREGREMGVSRHAAYAAHGQMDVRIPPFFFIWPHRFT
jgi:hypothetical protein